MEENSTWKSCITAKYGNVEERGGGGGGGGGGGVCGVSLFVQKATMVLVSRKSLLRKLVS